jgi:hypothetical protein
MTGRDGYTVEGIGGERLAAYLANDRDRAL